MKVSGEKHSLYLKWRPRLRLVAACLMLFYLLADCTILEYFSGNTLLGIPAYNKTVVLNSASDEIDETSGTRGSIDVTHISGSRKSVLSTDDDDCFCCSSHIALGYSQMIVSVAVPVVSRQTSSFFFRRQERSDSHLPPFYRPPQLG